MVVVDTSVALKWFFIEEGADRAKALLETEELAAPDLLLYEFTNALACHHQQSESDIQKSLELFYDFNLQFFILPQNGFRRVLNLCRKFGLSGYDASFVALAEILEVDFITADQKLVRKVKPLSFVHYLG